MSKKRKRLRRLCVVLALLLLLTGAELLYSNYRLTVSRYTVSSEKATGSFRLVFLADLHGREFGTGNERLLEKIAAEEPDLICLVGDLFNEDADEAETERVCALIQSAADLAPVYFCMGNHEYAYQKNHADALRARIEAAGAVVLDHEFLDLDLNGTPVRLGGYEGFYHTPHLDTADPELQATLSAFETEFQDTDRLKLLMDHIPTTWLDWDYRDKLPVDLVLSGHYHGGVARIPLLERGLYAPYVGKFPPYTKGMFTGKSATCILTTGLAGSYGMPRFFNPPELVVVDVVAP